MSKQVVYIELGGGRALRLETDRDAAGNVTQVRGALLASVERFDLDAPAAAELQAAVCDDDAGHA